MPEIVQPVEMVQVRFLCEVPLASGDPCRQEIKPTGYSVATNPPMYQHTCPAGHRQMHDKVYPYLDSRPRQGATDAPRPVTARPDPC